MEIQLSPPPSTQATLLEYFSSSETHCTKRSFQNVDSVAGRSQLPAAKHAKHVTTITSLTSVTTTAETHQLYDHLCDRCKRIDFEDAFKMCDSVQGRPIIDLNVNKKMKESACALCRMFYAVHVPDRPGNKPHGQRSHLRAFSEYAISSKRKNHRSRTDKSVALAVAPGSRNAWRKESRYLCLAHGFIACISTLFFSQSLFRGLRVDPVTADFDLMRRWLRSCKKYHKNYCEKKTFNRPFPLRYINYSNRRIVEVSEHDKYITLSYVWDQAERNGIAEGTTLKALPEYLPTSGVSQIIENTLTVTEKLGRQYLWVDKYCINQEDSLDKHIQIRNMDRIYEGALITIIAVIGDNPGSGIPGVSASRILQPAAFVDGRTLMSTLRRLSFPLQESVWNSRGWTY